MKLLIGAALAASLMIAGAASAQTAATPAPAPSVGVSRCAAATAAPAVPDGATATPEQMETANTAYVAWANATRTIIECRRAEFEELRAQSQARFAEHNEIVSSLNNTSTAWQAARTTFCERPRQRCRETQ